MVLLYVLKYFISVSSYIFMFFKLIESFDIYSGSISSGLIKNAHANFFFRVYHDISFNKLRWLVVFVIIFAVVIFYINIKTLKNIIFFNTFLASFNKQLKTALFFKKNNILNWFFTLFIFILLTNTLGLIPETIALNSIFFVTFFLSIWMSFTYNFYGITLKKELWFNLFRLHFHHFYSFSGAATAGVTRTGERTRSDNMF